LLDHEDRITVGVLDVRDPFSPRPILRLGQPADPALEELRVERIQVVDIRAEDKVAGSPVLTGRP